MSLEHLLLSQHPSQSLLIVRTEEKVPIPVQSFKAFPVAFPHGGVRPFHHQKSTCLTPSTVGRYAVQIWLRGSRTSEATEPSNSTVRWSCEWAPWWRKRRCRFSQPSRTGERCPPRQKSRVERLKETAEVSQVTVDYHGLVFKAHGLLYHSTSGSRPF